MEGIEMSFVKNGPVGNIYYKSLLQSSIICLTLLCKSQDEQRHNRKRLSALILDLSKFSQNFIPVKDSATIDVQLYVRPCIRHMLREELRRVHRLHI